MFFGIYKLDIMKRTIFKLLSISIIFIWTDCHNHEADHPHGHGNEKEQHLEENHREDEVHLLQKQMDVMGIELGQFREVNLSTTIKSNGQLELPPRNKASLSAVMAGRVKDIFVLEGDAVNIGQTLALLEHPDFIEIQQEYIESRSHLDFLEKDYFRIKQLFHDSVSSAKNFQRAESAYLAELGENNSLKAKLNLLNIDISEIEAGRISAHIPIKSPINGYVRLVEVNMGTYVEPQQEMFEIVDNDHIHIDLMIYEKDISKIKEGQNVIFSITTKPDSLYQGHIFAIGKAFENDIKAVTVHAEIENKSGFLLPGMYVDARIVCDQRNVAALPDEAVVADAGLNYIFVQKEEQQHHNHGHSDEEHQHQKEKQSHSDEYIFEKIEVNTGASDIGFTEVVPAQQIPENATVVIKGAYYLLAEMKKGEVGHGHHH